MEFEFCLSVWWMCAWSGANRGTDWGETLGLRAGRRWVGGTGDWGRWGSVFVGVGGTWTDEHSDCVRELDRVHINGLVQERCKSSALAMELRLSCTDPSLRTLILISFKLVLTIHSTCQYYIRCWFVAQQVSKREETRNNVTLDSMSRKTMCLVHSCSKVMGFFFCGGKIWCLFLRYRLETLCVA